MSIQTHQKESLKVINGKTVALVMPCRNESGHLAQFISDIPDFFDEIICVSNKSTDDTVAIGQQLATQYPRLKFMEDNRTAKGIGYGYAHMTGMKAATSDYIVCADSDGTYPVEDTPSLLRMMDKRHLRFVSCSRYPDKQIPIKLQLGVKILNIEIAILYGFIIHDSLSGMWIFEREIIPQLRLTEGDWNLSPQIKLNARRALKSQFAELKIVQKIRQGETKQNYFDTGFRHLCWIAKNRFVQRRGVQSPD